MGGRDQVQALCSVKHFITAECTVQTNDTINCVSAYLLPLIAAERLVLTTQGGC